jgi:hypothetical protein
MSIAISPNAFLKSNSNFTPLPSFHAAHGPQVTEAPERAIQAQEAPEFRTGRPIEAPDAGEGRVALMEHEFTHGRSQS